MPNHTGLTCEREKGGCGLVFSFLPGWKVLRKLRGSEKSKPPNGTLWCTGCGAKWLVTPACQQKDAA